MPGLPNLADSEQTPFLAGSDLTCSLLSRQHCHADLYLGLKYGFTSFAKPVERRREVYTSAQQEQHKLCHTPLPSRQPEFYFEQPYRRRRRRISDRQHSLRVPAQILWYLASRTQKVSHSQVGLGNTRLPNTVPELVQEIYPRRRSRIHNATYTSEQTE
jgi:hypothetical protein